MKKILTIPFYICLYGIPLGIAYLLLMIPGIGDLIRDYGEWSFNQWEEKPKLYVDEVLDIEEN